MKKLLRITSLILIIAMLLGTFLSFADGEEQEGDAAETEAAAENASSVRIMFTGGIHSNLEQIPLISTAYKQQKEESAASFLVDAGNFSMGTPYQTIFTTHAAELRTMGAAGFDVTTLGVSEFAYGTAGLTSMLSKAVMDDKVVLPEMVISNIIWNYSVDGTGTGDAALRLGNAMNAYGAKDYTVIRRAGTSVAFFGLLSGGSGEADAPAFADISSAAGRLVPEIKEKEDVDLVVCLIQAGTGGEGKALSEARTLAQKVGGIDLIISGGAESLEEPETVNETIIVSSGENAVNLGCIEIDITDEAEDPLLDYRLIPLLEKADSSEEEADTQDEATDEATDEETDEASEESSEEDAETGSDAEMPEGYEGFERDADVNDKVVGFKAAVDKDFFSYYGLSWEKTIVTNDIAFTPAEEFGTEHGEDLLGDLITDSLVYAVKTAEGDNYDPVSAAIFSPDVLKNSIWIGDVTPGDIFNALPQGRGKDGSTGYPLVDLWLTGEDLKYLAEADVTTLRNPKLPRLYFAGLEYKWNPHRVVLDRAYQIELRDEEGTSVEIEEKKLYRVVTDIYTAGLLKLTGTESRGLLKVTPRDNKGQAIETFEDRILHTAYGDEIKEWYAVASYLDSFDGDTIPDDYRTLQGRKLLVDSRSPIEILRNPNEFFFVVTALIILVILLIYVAVKFIVRTVVRRKLARQKETEAASPAAPVEITAESEPGEVSSEMPPESGETEAPEEPETRKNEEESAETGAPAVEGDSEPDIASGVSPEDAEGEAPEDVEEKTEAGEPEEEPEPEKPLWSEIFTSVDINWNSEDGESPEAQPAEEPAEAENGLPETGIIDDSGRDTPFGPAPAREEADSDLSLIKSLFADMGDLGTDVVGAVAPNVEPEEPVVEHFDFDWSQDIPEPEAQPELAPEDRIKEGEKVFERAVRIDDEEELAALLSAEELLNQKVSKLKQDKNSGKKGARSKKNASAAKSGGDGTARKEKKYHLSDKRKRRK